MARIVIVTLIYHRHKLQILLLVFTSSWLQILTQTELTQQVFCDFSLVSQMQTLR
jgi:hypothetical protein